jgi:hypothetical protein
MATGVFGGRCIEAHTVYIYDRGGQTRVAQIVDVSELRWERNRDSVSEAKVRIEGSACSFQADILAAIEPKRSEIVIYRGSERVWEGPVWRVSWHSTYVEIYAHDVMAYVHGTPLSKAYSNAYPAVGQVIDRVKTIMDAEMPVWEALTPPINVMPYVVYHRTDTGPKTTAVTKPFEMTVGEHIQHLAHYGGIDFVVVGRAIHFWDVDDHLGRTRMMTEADFLSEVIITAYGADMAAKVYVIGEDGVYGFAESPSPYYGPWTHILTAYNEEGTEAPGQEELTSQAERNLAGRNPVPVEVRVPDNSGIRLDDTLGINDLIPGTQVPLLATLNARQMSQMQKLDLVTVTESPDGETVQVTLTPSTADPETPVA